MSAAWSNAKSFFPFFDAAIKVAMEMRKAHYTKRKRLAWSGNNEAQRQADAAYAKLKPKKKPSKGQRRKARKLAKAKAKAREAVRVRPNYYEYINSAAWQRKRRQAFKHYGRKCAICGSEKMLRVHHLTYINLGWEPMEDLQVLCNGCHSNTHEDKGYADDITKEYLALHL